MVLFRLCVRGKLRGIYRCKGSATTHRSEASHGAVRFLYAESPVSHPTALSFSASVKDSARATALLLERYGFRGVEFPLFLFAIALTVWYAGVGPAILAVVLSSLAFDYFFTEPRYSLYGRSSEIPYYVVFILFASLLAWFSAVRRRVERELLQSRDELQREVTERTQQASLLNLTHDTIFVRDMSDVITYWNRGAQELYGWSPEQAIGKSSHELLRTVFPSPLDDIRGEFLQTWASGRGNSSTRKLDGTPGGGGQSMGAAA